MILKIIKSTAFTLFLLVTATSSVLAAPIDVTPNSNIINNKINNRDFEIIVDYGYPLVTDESTIINLKENDTDITFSSHVDGNALYIQKSTSYLEGKTYAVIIQNIKSSNEEVNLLDYQNTFVYSSFNQIEIGKSVLNRSIYAYTLGEGDIKYLFVGGIHGDEKNTVSLVTLLMNNFKISPYLIPSNAQLIFIPSLNPDGYAKNNRLNAHGVDLNRNSKTADWQSKTYWGYTMLRYGGGRKPNSEPEIQAIQNYITNVKPLYTVFYHSAGGYTISNSLKSRYLSKIYAQKAVYSYASHSGPDAAFEYKITGDITIWMSQLGYRATTVELNTKQWTDASKNLRAVTYIINMPR